MKKSFSISFVELKSFGAQELQHLYMLMSENKYSEHNGLGFDNILLDNTLLSARLVKRVPTTIPQFDLNTGAFFEQKVFLFSKVNFLIDGKFNVIEIYGPVKEAPKLRTALYPLLPNHIQAVQMRFSLDKVFLNLLKNFQDVKIENIVINNFVHQPRVIGNYSIKSAGGEFMGEALAQYKHDVTRFTCFISDSSWGGVELSISKEGVFRINCEESIFPELLDQLKYSFFSNKDE